MSKVEAGGGPNNPPSRLRVTIFSSRLLGLKMVGALHRVRLNCHYTDFKNCSRILMNCHYMLVTNTIHGPI